MEDTPMMGPMHESESQLQPSISIQPSISTPTQPNRFPSPSSARKNSPYPSPQSQHLSPPSIGETDSLSIAFINQGSNLMTKSRSVNRSTLQALPDSKLDAALKRKPGLHRSDPILGNPETPPNISNEVNSMMMKGSLVNEINLTVPFNVAQPSSVRYSSKSPSQRKLSKSPSPNASRRQESSSKHVPSSHVLITQCSRNDAVQIIISLLELIIMKGWPFSIVKKVNGLPGPFENFVRLIRPGFADEWMPSSTELGGNLLDQMHSRIYQNTMNIITTALNSGYGTIVFDGWIDPTGSPVVNIMLHVKETINTAIFIFFLDSVFTGTKKMDSVAYMEEVEKVLSKCGGSDRICAVTSDNKGACKKARESFASKYSRVVSVNDQAHISDLLMKDLPKMLPWIDEVVKRVMTVVVEMSNRPHLREQFKLLMASYNKNIKGIISKIGRSYDILEEAPLVGNRDPDKCLNFNESEFNQYVHLRTAVLPMIQSATRFASTESVLDSFLRGGPVYLALIDSSSFDKSFPRSCKRKSAFVEPIKSDDLASNVKSLLRVFTVIRKYLRVFDSDTCNISEVYPLTIALEKRLREMPIDNFLTHDRLAELIEVFTKRKSKENRSRAMVHLLADIHIAAYLLDPIDCPGVYTSHMDAFKRHASVYADGLHISNKSSFVLKLTKSYQEAHGLWQGQKIVDRDRENLEMYKRKPLMYWISGAYSDKVLTEFAVRTLSTIPSAMVVDRSFSIQGQIQKKERSRLSKQKVSKLMFAVGIYKR